MASVNWGGNHGKAKSYKRSRVRGQNLLKHCDQEFRQELNKQHHNKDIDPSKSYLNQNFTGMSYEESRDKWYKRLDELEGRMEKETGRSVRKDCVELTSLEMAVPNGMTDEQARQFFQDFYDLCVKKFGKENIISANSHFDEIHEYEDASDGEIKISRPHIHIQIVPEVDGRLCNKEFSSLKNISELNQEVSDLCWQRYHLRFNTGERVRKKTVERLKRESEYVTELEKQKEAADIENERQRSYLENIHINDESTALDDLRAGGDGTAVNKAVSSRENKKLKEKEEEIVSLHGQINDFEEQIRHLNDQLFIYEDREKKIRRGIEVSSDPEGIQQGLKETLDQLYQRGSDSMILENGIEKGR